MNIAAIAALAIFLAASGLSAQAQPMPAQLVRVWAPDGVSCDLPDDDVDGEFPYQLVATNGNAGHQATCRLVSAGPPISQGSRYDREADAYVCPAGKLLRQRQKLYRTPTPLVDEDGMMRYCSSKLGDACALKPRCCPTTPAWKIPRSIHEGARDMARAIAGTDTYATSRRQRKKVEMLFAHLKRILKLDRLRLRGPNGARDEFLLAATAQNLRKLAKLLPSTPQISPA
ncbi:hypothetical protein FHS53_000597 [Xanthobacter tagetidis]|nr:hypothetical protein [Xanthobacter tagetidis]